MVQLVQMGQLVLYANRASGATVWGLRAPLVSSTGLLRLSVSQAGSIQLQFERFYENLILPCRS